MSAIGYVSSVKNLMLVKRDSCVGESQVFRMSYSFMTSCLLICSLLVGAHEYFGKPIECITDVASNVIESYCWITSTFTMMDYKER